MGYLFNPKRERFSVASYVHIFYYPVFFTIKLKKVPNFQNEFLFLTSPKCLFVTHAKFGYDQANRGKDMSWSSLFRSACVAKLNSHVLLSILFATACLEYIVFKYSDLVLAYAAQTS